MGLIRSAVASLLRKREAPEKPNSGHEAGHAAEILDDAERLAASGQLAAALEAVDQALATDVTSLPLRLLRVDILRRWGREHEAARTVDGLDASAEASPKLRRLRAWAATRAGRMDDAVRDLVRVVENGGDADATVDLAKALQALGRHDDAEAWLARARAARPGDTSLLLQSGINELARRRLDAAESWFRRALDVQPRLARAHEHLGVVLAALDRQAEALDALAKARPLATDDELGGILSNIAIGHCELADVDRGVDALAAGLPTHPVLNGFLQLGPALLTQGRFREGWRQYEHRWLVEPLASVRADYGVPPWRGQPLEGRTIFVRAEQGLGDVFQFVRYLPLLKERGARVLFQPLRGIDTIARRFPGVDVVVREGERLPPFDYYVNLLSLPDAFGTTLATIPATFPYLSAEPGYREKWRTRLGARNRPRVALSWAGRPEHRQDRHRSVALDALAPILAIDGITFVSMQKGPAAVQAEAVPESVDWRGVGAELDDLDDAAAVLAEVDLLVCVDTGLAHLAGAMGKSVWVLLPTPSDFRWLEEREDTPWYPTLRLFRQRTPRQWAPEVARIADALVEWRDPWRGPVEHGIVAPARPAPPPPGEVPLSGIAVAGDTHSGFLQYDPGDRPVGASLETYGEWSRARLDLVLRFTRPGATILEAGAGVGAHTLPLARAVGRAGLVLAYETRLSQRRLLAGNLAAHDLGQVTVMTRALGAPSVAFDDAHESLDALALPRLDGIVVHEAADAEAILTGGESTLWRCRPWLMLACDDTATLARVREWLRGPGYRAWRVDAPLDPPDNYYRADASLFGGASSHAMWAIPEEVDFRAGLPGAEPWP